MVINGTRCDQLDNVVNLLREIPNSTRQAAISIYDGKEIYKYDNDTPCTYAVQFSIVDGKLCMSVYMRSNDLWYGFCNSVMISISLHHCRKWLQTDCLYQLAGITTTRTTYICITIN